MDSIPLRDNLCTIFFLSSALCRIRSDRDKTFANEEYVNGVIGSLFLHLATACVVAVMVQIARKLKCELDNSTADFAAQQLRK